MQYVNTVKNHLHMLWVEMVNIIVIKNAMVTIRKEKQMRCSYCPEEIDDSNYTYMPFKDTDNQVMMMKPVHSYHLDATRGMDKTTPYKQERGQDAIPTDEEKNDEHIRA